MVDAAREQARLLGTGLVPTTGYDGRLDRSERETRTKTFFCTFTGSIPLMNTLAFAQDSFEPFLIHAASVLDCVFGPAIAGNHARR